MKVESTRGGEVQFDFCVGGDDVVVGGVGRSRLRVNNFPVIPNLRQASVWDPGSRILWAIYKFSVII